MGGQLGGAPGPRHTVGRPASREYSHTVSWMQRHIIALRACLRDALLRPIAPRLVPSRAHASIPANHWCASCETGCADGSAAAHCITRQQGGRTQRQGDASWMSAHPSGLRRPPPGPPLACQPLPTCCRPHWRCPCQHLPSQPLRCSGRARRCCRPAGNSRRLHCRACRALQYLAVLALHRSLRMHQRPSG